MVTRAPARQIAFVAALRPLEPAVGRLRTPDVVARLAAVLTTVEETVHRGSAGTSSTNDLNSAMAPLQWGGLLAAERAGAAHQVDATPAIWAWY